jgi:hypothetical protein
MMTGAADHQARQRRHLQLQHEGFGGLRVNQLAARRQDLLQRAHDEAEDAVDEGEGDQEPDADGADRDDQPPPELVEVLQKRHLPSRGSVVSIEIVLLGIVVGRRPGGRPRKRNQ